MRLAEHGLRCHGSETACVATRVQETQRPSDVVASVVGVVCSRGTRACSIQFVDTFSDGDAPPQVPVSKQFWCKKKKN